VKRFLKEPGGADLYPALEIKWQRGHDPDIEVRRCTSLRDPKGPSDDESAGPNSQGSELVETVSLARFNTVQLHYLLQCYGMSPSRPTATTPIAASAAVACAELPPPGWSWMSITLGVFALCLPLGLLARCLRLGPWQPKVKNEDRIPKDII